ncbi:expressed unknown protein [Seminavis robusta]|uniref:Uncharacterized protein n=1 Tax=Seminavis robusta TaxID=568900 RepID=A0A9N8D9F5_9STRA|nr:expressed unknown protein [Seminavis robusta]|eukprot:Sro45_g026931.1  (95) ;mRNA; r:76159-76443
MTFEPGYNELGGILKLGEVLTCRTLIYSSKSSSSNRSSASCRIACRRACGDVLGAESPWDGSTLHSSLIGNRFDGSVVSWWMVSGFLDVKLKAL